MRLTRVFKYELPVGDEVSIDMPRGAEILHVDVQNHRPYLWARVDASAPPEARHFRFAGTGHTLDDRVGKHVGSFLMEGGHLVFHIFELLR